MIYTKESSSAEQKNINEQYEVLSTEMSVGISFASFCVSNADCMENLQGIYPQFDTDRVN